jgi:uncharacterized protein YceK
MLPDTIFRRKVRMKKIRRLTVLFMAGCLLVGLYGCQSTSSFYQGKQLEPNTVVPITETKKSDKWSTFALTITFDQEKNDNLFSISGEIELSDHYQMNYTSLERLNVLILFVDNNSQVLQADRLFNNHSGSLDDTFTFNRQLPVSERATGYSFSYDLAARSD